MVGGSGGCGSRSDQRVGGLGRLGRVLFQKDFKTSTMRRRVSGRYRGDTGTLFQIRGIVPRVPGSVLSSLCQRLCVDRESGLET